MKSLFNGYNRKKIYGRVNRNVNIGERIKQIRKSYSMSQATFASHIGISQGTLSEIERGKFNPSVETVISISEKMGVKTDWLLRGDSIVGDLSTNLELFEDQLIQKIYNVIQEYINKTFEINEELKEKVLFELINDIHALISDTPLISEEIGLLKKYRTLLPKDKKEIQAIVDLKQTNMISY